MTLTRNITIASIGAGTLAELSANITDQNVLGTSTVFAGDITGTSSATVVDGLITKTTQFSLQHSAFQTGSTTNDVQLFSLLAGWELDTVTILHTARFLGGLISAYTLSVGILGDLTKYAPAHDVFQNVSSTVFGGPTVTNDIENSGAAASIRIAAVSTGADLSATVSGQVIVAVTMHQSIA